jgi:hypothetical protein
MHRRDFLKLAGMAAEAAAAPQAALLPSLVFAEEQSAPAVGRDYGLLECADAKLLAALSRSRTGILRCTVNDQTHCADAGLRWGTITVLNDLYFGLHGGFFIGGADQHAVFRKELRKIARHVKTSPDHPPVPWSVSADGQRPRFNDDPGYDLDRSAEFVLEVVRTYEMTGDRQFASDLYPQCREVVDYLAARDLDDDLLPEGRTETFVGKVRPGVCACSSVSYIGDTSANAWKDFGATLFYYEALRWLALLENILGKKPDAAHHLEQAGRVRDAARKILWHESTNGFLAWVDRDGTPHDDWITGNNLHAVASGLASREQSVKILRKLEEHRAEVEEIIPCRVRIGIFAEGLCHNRPEDYWNGGIWTLVSAPDMRARAQMGDVAGALHVANLLATHPKVTDVGFYEAYDGKTGEPNNCRGLLMNNGGFIWGFFEAVMGIEVEGDELRFRPSVPKQVTPARARLHYRGADLEIDWRNGRNPGASLDGKSLARSDGGFYRLNLSPQARRTYHVEIVTEDIPDGKRLLSQLDTPQFS